MLRKEHNLLRQSSDTEDVCIVFENSPLQMLLRRSEIPDDVGHTLIYD